MTSPVHFVCPVGRRTREWVTLPNGRLDLKQVNRSAHQITLTGQTKPNPSTKRSWRTSATSREFKCSCGHRGWSVHIDLENPLRFPTEETS